MKLREKKIIVLPNRICSTKFCGSQPNKPIVNPVLGYEDKDSGDLIVLGKDKDGYYSSVLYDKQMNIKKQTDSHGNLDYTAYSKSVLKSRKNFSQEGKIGKARITYQILQDWGY